MNKRVEDVAGKRTIIHHPTLRPAVGPLCIDLAMRRDFPSSQTLHLNQSPGHERTGVSLPSRNGDGFRADKG